MEFFKINRDTWDLSSEETDLSGAKQISWVERYNFPGEFTIIGEPTALLSKLPLGCCISHSMTDTIMVVENHIIDESEGETAKMTVTGRTIDACYMDDRVVSFNKDLVAEEVTDIWSVLDIAEMTDYPMQFEMDNVVSWIFVTRLLIDHLVDTRSGEPENIPNLYIARIGIDGLYAESADHRCTKRPSYLSDAVYEELQAFDLGLKVCRPGPERLDIETAFINSGGTFDPNDPENCLMFVIHRGEDLSDTVIFDFNNADLHKARYFMSIRDQKTGFYSTNREYAYRNLEFQIGSNARLGLADASDYVSGTADISAVKGVLSERGRRLFNPNNSGINKIVDVVISKNTDKKYQIDYKIGDIVNVFGNYDTNEKMRVTEIAIVQDNSGTSIIPTLSPSFTETIIT